MDPDAANFLLALQLLNDQFAGFDPSKPLESDDDSQSESDVNATTASENVGEPRAATTTTTPDLVDGDDLDPEETASSDFIFGLSHITPDQKITEEPAPRKPAKMVRWDAPKMVNGTWPTTGLGRGEISRPDVSFCPWEVVVTYPKNYVGKRNNEACAPLWTNVALTDDLTWDLHYMYDPNHSDQEPVIFVPTYQFEHLLDVVNGKIDSYLCIPGGSNEQKFRVKFDKNMTIRPRFLGRSTTTEDFDDLTDDYPDPHPSDDVNKLAPEQKGVLLALFKSIIKWGALDKKKKRDANRAKRIVAHQGWGRALKRAQRYLSLREAIKPGYKTKPQVLDVSKPLAMKPESSVLMIAIDLEAYEHNQTIISEVGIATLDTAKLVGVPPGEGGENWVGMIEARHIRIRENTWVRNRDYVHGCPDRFDFGTSEFVPGKDTPGLLQEIIDDAKSPGTDEPRNVVLVFHDRHGDLKYLQTLGYNPFAALNVLEIFDTREMDQVIRRSNNQTSLANVLTRLGVSAGNLHNAGNDAVYTLRAMIGMAVEKRLLSDRKRSGEDHVPWSEFHEKDGWSSGEDTDGGYPGPFFATREDVGAF